VIGGRAVRHTDFRGDEDLTNESSRKNRLKESLERREIKDTQDDQFGFERYKEGPPIRGWLLNMSQVCVKYV